MIAIILAGGSGTRLWPLSRQKTPKQFLNLADPAQSLFQQTLQRVRPLVQPQDFLVVGSHNHELELTRQAKAVLPEMGSENFLLEPASRNTAPAILWGLSKLSAQDRQRPVVILAADHLIAKEDLFCQVLSQAQDLTQEGYIVIFGIKPESPHTGYGYIKAGQALKQGHKVERFEEKPSQAKAHEYIASPDYSWNSGIFMASVQTFLDEFQTHSPQLFGLFFNPDQSPRDLSAPGQIQAVFAQAESISVDYALAEKSSRFAVMTLDVGWNDLGSFESLFQIKEKDQQGNVLQGNVEAVDCQDCMILGKRKLIAAIGLEHLLVIDTDDATLICDMRESQQVKTIVNRLLKSQPHLTENHPKVLRPWGSYVTLIEEPGYKVKRIVVHPGQRLSLQRHFHRSEHWVVVKGTAEVTRGEEILYLTENQSTYLPKTVLHRLANPAKMDLEIIEVQLGAYLGEDDIIRIADDYGRKAET